MTAGLVARVSVLVFALACSDSAPLGTRADSCHEQQCCYDLVYPRDVPLNELARLCRTKLEGSGCGKAACDVLLTVRLGELGDQAWGELSPYSVPIEIGYTTEGFERLFETGFARSRPEQLAVTQWRAVHRLGSAPSGWADAILDELSAEGDAARRRHRMMWALAADYPVASTRLLQSGSWLEPAALEERKEVVRTAAALHRRAGRGELLDAAVQDACLREPDVERALDEWDALSVCGKQVALRSAPIETLYDDRTRELSRGFRLQDLPKRRRTGLPVPWHGPWRIARYGAGQP